MATFMHREGLQLILALRMEEFRRSGVSAIADFSTVVHLPTVAIAVYSGRAVHATRSTVRLTFNLAVGTVDCESATVYELANDKDSPPFKRVGEYSRFPGQSFTEHDCPPRLFGSVIEVETAPASNLLTALAAACLKKAKKAIADMEEGQ